MTHDPWAETDTWPTPRILASSPHVSPSPREAKWAEAACTTDLFRIGRLIALADSERAEDAATIAELRAERDAAREDCGLQRAFAKTFAWERDNFIDQRTKERARADAAEAETAALRARIEALADEFMREATSDSAECPDGECGACTMGNVATRLNLTLAALAGAPAVTPTESTAPPGVYGPDRQCVCCWDGHGGDCRCVDCAVTPTETQAEDGAWTCGSCGSGRWMFVAPGGPDWPRKAQCVPCGAVQSLPAPVADRTTGETR